MMKIPSNSRRRLPEGAIPFPSNPTPPGEGVFGFSNITSDRSRRSFYSTDDLACAVHIGNTAFVASHLGLGLAIKRKLAGFSDMRAGDRNLLDGLNLETFTPRDVEHYAMRLGYFAAFGQFAARMDAPPPLSPEVFEQLIRRGA
tara:strand:- start:670 stop:1101 length:432 start_codon:yes stop_codon:yes gene_type:complete